MQPPQQAHQINSLDDIVRLLDLRVLYDKRPFLLQANPEKQDQWLFAWVDGEKYVLVSPQGFLPVSGATEGEGIEIQLGTNTKESQSPFSVGIRYKWNAGGELIIERLELWRSTDGFAEVYVDFKADGSWDTRWSRNFVEGQSRLWAFVDHQWRDVVEFDGQFMAQLKEERTLLTLHGDRVVSCSRSKLKGSYRWKGRLVWKD